MARILCIFERESQIKKSAFYFLLWPLFYLGSPIFSHAFATHLQLDRKPKEETIADAVRKSSFTKVQKVAKRGHRGGLCSNSHHFLQTLWVPGDC